MVRLIGVVGLALAAVALVSGKPYDPDVDLTTVQIIRRHGYPAEAHTIQTDDGYLLTLHRIPGVGNRTPVLLQHGLLGSSVDWVVAGPGKALVYLLADSGYDVWLGNARGNTYSRAHVTLSTKSAEFWNFSFHEMGVHDLPAAIDHIVNVTRHEKLFYIGHSMGTTMFYVMASEKPKYNDKIQTMFSLAPIAFMSRLKSPIRLLGPIANDIEFIAHYLGADEFLPQNKILHFLAKYGCLLYVTEKKVCENFIFLIAGFDSAQFNMTLLPIILSHTPAGASTKTLTHYAQEIQSGMFQRYDYGTKGNLNIYHTPVPPKYNISLITAPMEFHYAQNDWLANVNDVDELYRSLSNKLGKFLVDFPKFNHLDFLWGKDTKELVYDKVLAHMKNHKHYAKNIIVGSDKIKQTA